MAGISEASLPRKRAVYSYVREDGVVANCISSALAGSDFRRKCEICGKKFKSNKQAYAHLKTHRDVVIVQKIGEAGYYQQDKRIPGDTVIGVSNTVESEADGDERGRCEPPDVTAEYGTRVLYTAGEEEGLEEHPSSSEFHNVDLLYDNERNESDGAGDIGEDFFGQFPPDSDADGDAEADHEVGPPFISEESMAQRAATVAYANANIIHGQTVNEDILRTSMSSAFENFQRGEEGNRETDAQDEFGIAFQEECLASMCRAADLAGIGQLNNELDESEFDIEEVAKELSLPVDPDNPMSISVGQYCIDQLMIMQVIFPYVRLCLRISYQFLIER
jgi:hypothetical protein